MTRSIRAAALALACVLPLAVPARAQTPASGWKDLFDGKTTAGWRGYKQAGMPAGWIVPLCVA